MADDKDLRNALDAVNAGRKWTLLGMAALFFAITITLGFVFAMLIPALQPPGVPQEIAIEPAAGAPSIASNRLMPSKVLVPRPISSIRIKLLAEILLRMIAVSFISTMNVDSPDEILSDAPTRVNNLSMIPSFAAFAGI